MAVSVRPPVAVGQRSSPPQTPTDRPGGAEAPIIFREIERHDSRAAPVGSKNAIPVAVAVGPSLSHSFRFRDEIEMEWSERAAAAARFGNAAPFYLASLTHTKNNRAKILGSSPLVPTSPSPSYRPLQRETQEEAGQSEQPIDSRRPRAREQRDGGRQNMRRRDGCHFSLYY